MRLCHIVPSLEERHGGPSRSARATAGALAEIGHDVELLTTAPATTSEEKVGRLHVRTFPRTWPEMLTPSTELRRHLTTSAFEVVHHHALWLRTLAYAHTNARRTGAKLVISPRGMMSHWAWRHNQWKKSLARALVHPGAIEGAHGWHATSPEEANDIRALGFKQPICIAPNGVSEPDPTEVARARAHWHRVCPAAVDRPVALFYSRFHPKKRLLELIDLWLTSAPPEWLLLVVGIPQAFTVAHLENYVLRSQGQDRIAVFDGTGAPPPYAAANLFVLPSHSENFGLVIAEALAHGLPALVTDTTPWRELQSQGLGGCVPFERYGATLRALLAERSDTRERRGAAAREWVLAHYSWTRSAALLADFYSQLRT